MTPVRPDKFNVELVYLCPDCGYDHEVEIEETVFPGGVRCVCGKKIKFEPVASVAVTPTYGKPMKKTEDEKSEPVRDTLLDDAIAALMGLGFMKKEATEFVYAHSILPSVEDFVREACHAT